MFFSIIIPTYNPNTCLTKLLESIDSNYCIDDIEIIISDDCSTEPFDDLLTPFSHLNIRKIVNDQHYGYPRVGRQNGMDAAKGDWLTVIDQDDYFELHTFDELRRQIILQKAKDCIYTSVNVIYQNTGEIILRDCPEEGTQGKFYERTFIEKYNIRYDNVTYVEDANFGMHVKCVLVTYGLHALRLHSPTYNWLQHEGSLSDIIHKDTYFFNSQQDYIKSTVGILLDEYERISKNNKMTDELEEDFKRAIIPSFFSIYFKFLGIKNPTNNCPELPQSYFDLIKNYFQRYKNDFNISTQDLLKLIEEDKILLDFFSFYRSNTYFYIPFIETITFHNWVHKYLDGEDVNEKNSNICSNEECIS